MSSTPPITADGCWYWDGSAWKSLLSPDGTSRWDGKAWVALTSAPSAAPGAPPGAPAPAPAPPPGAERPSWLPADAHYEEPRPRTPTPAEPAPAAPAAEAPAPAAVYSGWQRQPAAATGVKLSHLVGAETIAPVVLAAFVAVVGGGWFITQHPFGGAPAEPPAVLVASHAQIDYRTGETLRFAVTQEQHGVMKASDGTQVDAWDSVSAVEDWRVISVGGDGTYTVGVKFEKLSGQSDGVNVTFDPRRAKEAVLVVKPDGRVVSGGTNGSAGGKATNSVPASDQFFSVLPDHDVKAGDSWGKEWTRPNPLGTGSATYSTKNSFQRYDTLAQFGQCAVVRTTATLPIDMGMNIRQLLELTGDDTAGVPAGAVVEYKGSSNDDITTYVDMSSRLPVHMLDVSNFDLQMTFQGLPATGELAVLNGLKIQWAGHQSGSMDLLELPKTV